MTLSDKQLRQKVKWAEARRANMLDEMEAMFEHLSDIHAVLDERIEGAPESDTGGEVSSVGPLFDHDTHSLIISDDFSSYGGFSARSRGGACGVTS